MTPDARAAGPGGRPGLEPDRAKTLHDHTDNRRSTPSREDILAAVRANPKIPAPPQAVSRILEMTRDPDTDITDLAETVSRDSGLTVQLLRQANSALYAFKTPTSSVAVACMRLGLNRIRAAVLNQHIVNGLGEARPPGFEPDRYWQNALAISVAAENLSADIRPAMADEASTAGLLCDIGIGLLAYGFPAQYQPVLDSWMQKPGGGLDRIETQLLGVCHAEVGAAVLSDWKLDAHLVRAVRHHHVGPSELPAGDHGEFGAIVAAAALVARLAFEGSDIERVERLFALLDPLTDHADRVVGRLLDDLVEQIRQSADALAVDLGPTDAIAAGFRELQDAASVVDTSASEGPRAG